MASAQDRNVILVRPYYEKTGVLSGIYLSTKNLEALGYPQFTLSLMVNQDLFDTHSGHRD